MKQDEQTAPGAPSLPAPPPRVRFDASWRLAAAATLLLLLLPVAAALGAPRLASGPRSIAAAPAIPPLPRPPGGLTDLSARIADIPVVVTDVPDGASVAAAEALAGAKALTPERSFFESIWAALVVPPESFDVVAREGEALLRHPGEAEDLNGNPSQALRDAVAVLAGDEANANRLSNAAVALYDLSMAEAYGANDVGQEQSAVTGGGQYEFDLQKAATGLLEVARGRFAGNPAVGVNLAFFTSIQQPERIPAAIPFVRDVVRSDPGDLPARLLLASLQSRQPHIAAGYREAASTLAPLLGDPATGALGRAALGDAYLAAATVRQNEAPLTSRWLAKSAIGQYDLALAEAADPGLYNGWAIAANLLGDVRAAVAAENLAVQLAPGAIPFHLQLAALQEAAGDADGMRESARRAFDLSTDGWDPAAADVRFAFSGIPTIAFYSTPGDRGLFGYSVGSSRPALNTTASPQGGGYVVGLNEIPREDLPLMADWRLIGFPPDASAIEAIQASIVLADPAAGLDDAQAWFDRVANGASYYGNAPQQDGRRSLMVNTYWATVMAKGGELPADPERYDVARVYQLAESELRRAGHFDPAAKIAEAKANASSQDQGFDRIGALKDAGENRYLAGDRRGALDLFERARQESLKNFGSPEGSLLVDEAVAASAIGQSGRAKELLLAAAAREQVPAALLELGDMDLDRKDASGAIATYDLALATLRAARRTVDSDDTPGFSKADFLIAHGQNNRGIAALRSLQTTPNRPPDCTGQNRTRCGNARTDFRDALATDPNNQVYLLNLGWADRLLGDLKAARADLREAVTLDPTLFPAWNDLGVLSIQAGDRRAAARAFDAALRANPRYALAAWNQGVLLLRGGPAGIPRGQAYLSRAVRQDHGLQGEKPGFKTDESIYRVTFGETLRTEPGWTFGRFYGVAAAAFGSIALVSAAGAWFGLGLLAGAWKSAAEGLLGRAKKLRLYARLQKRGEVVRNGMSERWRKRLPWVVTGIVLAGVTAWSAWSNQPSIAWATIPLALAVTAWAVAMHELAHYLVAQRFGGRLVPAQWGTGVGLAILLAPIKATSGPFTGVRVEGADEQRAWWIHLAGPATSIVLAVGLWGLYLLRPLPLLLLGAEINLAVAAYNLLPNEALDGHPLVANRPWVVAVLSSVIVGLGTVFALGLV